MLLNRQDTFLFVADALLGDRTAQLELTASWPLAPNVTFAQEAETHDGELLADSAVAATVIPLSLPEWKTDRRTGQLAMHEQDVRLSQQGNATALYLPWLIDLNPKRIGKVQRTWRHLTVAEQLQIVPSDRAAGYRAQLGKAQWLFYRSLAPAANRTLLGQNLNCEFLAGRFRRSGEVDLIVEIETE